VGGKKSHQKKAAFWGKQRGSRERKKNRRMVRRRRGGNKRGQSPRRHPPTRGKEKASAKAFITSGDSWVEIGREKESVSGARGRENHGLRTKERSGGRLCDVSEGERWKGPNEKNEIRKKEPIGKATGEIKTGFQDQKQGKRQRATLRVLSERKRSPLHLSPIVRGPVGKKNVGGKGLGQRGMHGTSDTDRTLRGG